MLRIKPNNPTGYELNYVPLKQVKVESIIRSFAADVTITQIFRNDETKPIEAVYCFPIEEKAAIYSFIAKIDDRQILAELKEKKQAQKEYTNALEQGHGAYLLEQDENSQDNFIINVGALPPSKECTIIISYVTELEFIQGSIIQFIIPTTIAPRYNPNNSSIITPVNTNSKYVQSTPYTIDIHCRIDKMNRSKEEYIARINSPSHPIEIDFSQDDIYTITFAQQNTHLDRDIIINIELTNKRTNTILAIESNAIMAVFTPTEKDCYNVLNCEQTNEFLFVIDCSGSMQDESKIELARQALLLFLKSLPVNSHFNIIRFGSQYESLFTNITDIYNENNAKKAEKLINEMQANLGGTELMKPLQWIKQHSPGEGRARQIFLLTDGEISNVTEVLDLCRLMTSTTRIFSFGLGRSPSRSLVKGLARSTNGRFVFIPPNSKVDIYVGEQLQKALQPSINDVHIQWNLGIDIQSAPTQSSPIYVNDRLIVYALKNNNIQSFDHNSSVELKAGLNNHLIGLAKIDSIPSIAQNQTIARLAAKALILELQHEKFEKANIRSLQSRFKVINTTNEQSMEGISNEQTPKQRIIDLSLKYNILSPYTAFIGIEKRINTNNADMVLREVPIEITDDDQHLLKSISPLNNSISNMYGNAFGSRGGRGRDATMNRSRLVCYTSATCNNTPMNSYSMYSASSASIPTASLSCSSIVLPPMLNAARLEHNHSRSQRRRSRSPERFEKCRIGRQRSRSRERSSPRERSPERPIHRRMRFQRELSRSCERSSSRDRSPNIVSNEEILSSNDEDLIRDLIKKQEYDGLWNLNTQDIMNLTGKPLSIFQSTNNHIDTQILISIIILILFEKRFASFSSLWHGVAQKARKQIKNLLNKDSINLDTLIEDIRKQY